MKEEISWSPLHFLKIKTALSLLFLLFGLNGNGQDLDCEDFRNGVYYAEISKPITMKWKVTRNGNEQVEEVIELPKKAKGIGYPTHPRYEIIEWIDDCSYHLRYDETKFELSQSQKMINDNGGVLTRIVKVEGNCHYYISTLTVDGQEQSIEGKLCTE